HSPRTPQHTPSFPTRRSSDLIERQARLLQRHGPKKSNIQVRTRSGSQAIGADVERLHRIKCAERAPRIAGKLELPIDPLRHYGRSEEHTSELQSRENLVCRLL